MKSILLALLILLNLQYLNCTSKDKSNNKKKILLGGLLLLSSQNRGVDYNCNTSPSPKSFSEFQTAIDTLNTSGYKCSECHGVNTAQSNFIITNYSSVLERVNPSNPSTSVLYFKVKPGGAMNGYSNSNLNQAIYCWIRNGAVP